MRKSLARDGDSDGGRARLAAVLGAERPRRARPRSCQRTLGADLGQNPRDRPPGARADACRQHRRRSGVPADRLGSAAVSDGRIVIARPFGVPVDVTPTWFLVAGLITWGFAPTVEDTVPGIGRRGATPCRSPSRCCSTCPSWSTSSATPWSRCRPGCPCGGSACTCSAGSPRSSGPPRPPAARQASPPPGRLSRWSSPRLASGSGELLDPGTVGAPAAAGPAA